MGAGTFSISSYACYCTASGKEIDKETGYVTSGQNYTATSLNEDLNPYNKIRECVNTEEHPNTIPVILALDVTGSMGEACNKTAEALGVIMKKLYEKYQDIEIMIMGIGDLSYDRSPIQASQFESDIRIAENLDKLYIEYGGGPNAFESYTAAWYYGLYRTKLDAVDKQGRKGIIITMGDEQLNPYLSRNSLIHLLGEHKVNESIQSDNTEYIETNKLYDEVIKKFDVYHISIDDNASMYRYHKDEIKETFGSLLKENSKVSKINELEFKIIECIDNSLDSNVSAKDIQLNENGEICW